MQAGPSKRDDRSVEELLSFIEDSAGGGQDAGKGGKVGPLGRGMPAPACSHHAAYHRREAAARRAGGWMGRRWAAFDGRAMPRQGKKKSKGKGKRREGAGQEAEEVGGRPAWPLRQPPATQMPPKPTVSEPAPPRHSKTGSAGREREWLRGAAEQRILRHVGGEFSLGCRRAHENS